MIISRTKKGKFLLEQCKEKNLLTLDPLKLVEIFLMQSAQVRKRAEVLERIIALKLFPFRKTPKYSYMNLYELSKITKISKNIKSFFGMYGRLVKNFIVGINK